jgi:hypothetical protein
MNLGEILISALSGPLATVGKEQLVNLLDKFQEKKPREFKASIIALYPVIDMHLEDLVTETKTKIDDALVIALKGAIEESAAKHGVVLSNLDND